MTTASAGMGRFVADSSSRLARAQLSRAVIMNVANQRQESIVPAAASISSRSTANGAAMEVSFNCIRQVPRIRILIPNTTGLHQPVWDGVLTADSSRRRRHKRRQPGPNHTWIAPKPSVATPWSETRKTAMATAGRKRWTRVRTTASKAWDTSGSLVEGSRARLAVIPTSSK